MFDLVRMQAAIRDFGFEGWLLYDFRESNILARRVLQLPDSTHTSRRFACFIPAEGEPRRLVHRIESGVLDHIPGEKIVYLRWQEFETGIESLIGGARRIAMEYAPRNSNPYISRIAVEGENKMKAFIAGLAVAVLMAIGGAVILNGAAQQSATEAYTTKSARPG